MVIYPVPVEVTQARIQLIVDQTAKAPPKTINEDLKAVYETTAQAEESALVDGSDRRVELNGQTPSRRAFRALLLRKILEYLNTDFLGDRAFHPAHAIPELDDFALLLDVHFLDVHEST